MLPGTVHDEGSATVADKDDKLRREEIETRIIMAGLAGEIIQECIVCKGCGRFDRLWPGNEEQCYTCGGTGWNVKLKEARSTDGSSTMILSFSYRSGSGMVNGKGTS